MEKLNNRLTNIEQDLSAEDQPKIYKIDMENQIISYSGSSYKYTDLKSEIKSLQLKQQEILLIVNHPLVDGLFKLDDFSKVYDFKAQEFIVNQLFKKYYDYGMIICTLTGDGSNRNRPQNK